jgi:hypothetical protein
MWQKLDAGFANRCPKTVPVSSKNETGVKFMILKFLSKKNFVELADLFV